MTTMSALEKLGLPALPGATVPEPPQASPLPEPVGSTDLATLLDYYNTDELAVRTLAEVMQCAESASARVSAAKEAKEWRHGKTPQGALEVDTESGKVRVVWM